MVWKKSIFDNKTISSLTDKEGNKLTETKYILAYQKEFYENLYKESDYLMEEESSDIIGNDVNKLNALEKETLEGELTIEEITKALKNMSNDKSLLEIY